MAHSMGSQGRCRLARMLRHTAWQGPLSWLLLPSLVAGRDLECVVCTPTAGMDHMGPRWWS